MKITTRLFHRTLRAVLMDHPGSSGGALDPIEPACGQPEEPWDAAPLTLSTISSFDG
jgi:hypothetical protein